MVIRLKRLLSILLTLILICSLPLTALAATYTDVKDSDWSAQYISDLAQRGLLTGYSDGSFRPKNSMTIAETLAVLSRFYKLSPEVSGWLYSDYSDAVKSVVPSSLDWAYDELAVCLAAGIVTAAELSAMNLTENIKKAQFAALLVRAIDMETEALYMADTELSFTDASLIPPSYLGSVALLTALQVVGGDENNRFRPESDVTREVAAKMISLSLAHIESQGRELIIDEYNGMKKTEGIIFAASSGSLQLRLNNGLIREYSIPATAAIRVNGAVKTLNSSYVDCYCIVTETVNGITAVDITSDSAVTYIQGLLTSVSYTTNPRYIYLSDLNTGTRTKYNLATDAGIYQDGSKAELSALTTNNSIVIKVKNDLVTELRSYSNEAELTGTITALSFATTVTFKITDNQGAAWYFPLNISALPTIYRGKTVISIDRLSVGESVVITVENSAIKTISTDEASETISGQLMSVTSTTNETRWTIKDEKGTEHSLKLDAGAGVFSGSTPILLSAVTVGATVKVVVYGETVTEIYLISAAQSSAKVTGTVLAIDEGKRIITILVGGKLIYINYQGVVAQITASTGRYIAISSIKPESTLVAYGSYTSSVNFNAVTILIE